VASLHLSLAVVLVDFLHFIDAMVEGYGDPFYDLRYRCVTLQPLWKKLLHTTDSPQNVGNCSV
jgi:hypothetical protein